MRYKGLVMVFVAALLFGTGVAGVPRQGAAATADQTGIVVVGSMLNVRTGAGTSYAILQSDGVSVQLANGTKVKVLESLDSWYKISFTFNKKELSGYVSKQYIAIETAASPTPSPEASASPTQNMTYRNETTYKAISVAAKITAPVSVYKKDGITLFFVSKKKVVLSKDKKVTITGEKTLSGKKWFKLSFNYKKKTRTGYVRNTAVKMTLKKTPYAKITNEKASVKIRTKAGTKAPYKKLGKTTVKLSKNTEVKIWKEKTADNKKWYQIAFLYSGKTRKGYVNSRYVKLAKEKVTKKVPVTTLTSAEFEKAMTAEGFPDSYKQSLRALHRSYPYWQFKAYKTGVTWADALKAESKLGVNLISNNKSKAWKSTEEGAYNASTGKWKVFDGSTWVAASKQAIAYYMDPRNFLSDKTVFQFECLEYQSQYQSASGVNTIFSNTPFAKKNFKYKDLSTGKEKSISYTNAFLTAAKSSGVSPYHLASRVKQEVVTSATTTSIAVTGTNSSYPGIYNFYNIGATSGSNPAVNGLKWASTGSTYLRPWTDRYRSIVGGAQYIGTSYINKGQNTGYLQKFNVTPKNRYDHQYMTNVEAAYSEAIKTKNAYAGTMDKSPIVFSIPVYNNMPAEACGAPH